MDKKTDNREDDGLLSADDILGSEDTEYITVKAWKGNVRIKSLTAGDLMELVQSNEGPAKKTFNARLIIASVVDKNGTLVFSPSHQAALLRKSSKVSADIVMAILKLNGIDQKSQDARLEAAKNDSGETPPDASPTVLH